MRNQTYGFGSFRNKIWLRQSKDLAPEYQKGYHILFLQQIVIIILPQISLHTIVDNVTPFNITGYLWALS